MIRRIRGLHAVGLAGTALAMATAAGIGVTSAPVAATAATVGATQLANLVQPSDPMLSMGSGIAYGQPGPYVASGGLALSGSSGYATSPVATNPVTNFTVTAWFKTSRGGTIIGFDGAQSTTHSSKDKILWLDNSGRLVFGSYPNSTAREAISPSRSSYANNQWHLATVRVSAISGTTIFADGVAVATERNVTSSESYSGYWHVGWDDERYGNWYDTPSNPYFSGTIADATVFSSPLDSSVISSMSHASTQSGFTSSVTADGPTGYWPLYNATSVAPATSPTTTTAPPPTTTTAAPVLTSGLIGGNSKTNCVTLAGTGSTLTSNLAAVQSATGVTFNCLSTYIGSPTWAAWSSPWIDGSQYGFTSFAAQAGHEMVISLQLIPDSVCTATCANPLAWEQSCDSGAYNSYAQSLGQNLVSAGFGTSVLRVGTEMNGPWENDYTGTSTAEQQAWAQCFVQEVTAMRSVAGAHFQIDWNPNAAVMNFNLANYYPGNAYVNIIGVDAYDAFANGTQPTASSATFTSLAAETNGLDTVTAFAAQQNKPMSLPEWGTVDASSKGLGDDPYYVAGIGAFVKNNDVAFQAYFDPNADGIIPLASSDPNTLGAYHTAFS